MAKRERVFLTAAEWQKKLNAHERMNANDRRDFDEKFRFEISLTEDRRQALATIREVHGAGEAGWARCAAKGGCSVWTYKTWNDPVRDVQPQAQSLKKTAIACGKKGSYFN